MGFFGLLIVHLKFALDETIETAATDGVTVFFSPEFLDTLSNDELDFVLMHEVMHVVLKHLDRSTELDNYLYNIASDTVINSIILESKNNDLKSISLNGFGALMHLAPNGKEGREYTAEEVYEMLLSKAKKSPKNHADGNDGNSPNDGENDGDSNENVSEPTEFLNKPWRPLTRKLKIPAGVISPYR